MIMTSDYHSCAIPPWREEDILSCDMLLTLLEQAIGATCKCVCVCVCQKKYNDDPEKLEREREVCQWFF